MLIKRHNNLNTVFRRLRFSTVYLSVLLMVLGFCVSVSAEEEADFDHDSTGFILEGKHRFVACESCHVKGSFKTTLPRCSSCHSRVGPISASFKSLNHINSNDQCDDCHTTNTWNFVRRVDHGSVFGNCQSCHNGLTAPLFQGAGHPAPAGSDCSGCHRTNNFIPARL